MLLGKNRKKLLKGAFARNGDLRHFNNGGRFLLLTNVFPSVEHHGNVSFGLKNVKMSHLELQKN